jgi:hypothetical protein
VLQAECSRPSWRHCLSVQAPELQSYGQSPWTRVQKWRTLRGLGQLCPHPERKIVIRSRCRKIYCVQTL